MIDHRGAVNGGAIVLPDPGTERAPWEWTDLLTDHGVTMWNSVPAGWARHRGIHAETGMAIRSYSERGQPPPRVPSATSVRW